MWGSIMNWELFYHEAQIKCGLLIQKEPVTTRKYIFLDISFV